MGAHRLGNGYTSTAAICGEPSTVSHQQSGESY